MQIHCERISLPVALVCLVAASCVGRDEPHPSTQSPPLKALVIEPAVRAIEEKREEQADEPDVYWAGGLPPIPIRLKADNRHHLASIALGQNDLGADPAKLVETIREMLGDSSSWWGGIHFDWIGDSRLRYQEMHRVVIELAGFLGLREPNAVFWFWNDEMPDRVSVWRGRETTAGFRLTMAKGDRPLGHQKDETLTDTIHVRVQSRETGVAAVVTLSRKTLPEADFKDAATEIGQRVAAAKATGRRIRLVVHGDEGLDCRFWPQLLAEIVKRQSVEAVDCVELLDGWSPSLRCLRLYQPKIGQEFPEGVPEF